MITRQEKINQFYATMGAALATFSLIAMSFVLNGLQLYFTILAGFVISAILTYYMYDDIQNDRC
jgi:hypothetical protein